MADDGDLRRHVLALLDGRGAHMDFAAAIEGWPADARTAKPESAPHSAWELLEHLRLAQRDILDFTVGDDYREMTFPDDYWPPADVAPDEDAWNESIAGFRRDLEAMKTLIAAPETRLLRKLYPDGEATPLREALLLADHNAYHIGQIVYLRRMLEA